MYCEKYGTTQYSWLRHAEVPSNVPFASCVSSIVVKYLAPIIPINFLDVATSKCVHRSGVTVCVGGKEIVVKHHEKKIGCIGLHSSWASLWCCIGQSSLQLYLD
jgi:hypothetical protein